mgnify:CR=1 FL=1
MRLPGFPVAVTGETVSSVVGRHLLRTAGPKSRSLSFLGLRFASANALVPPDLAKLAGSMPSGHPWAGSPRDIVLRHTLVPLYLHFADPKRRASVLVSIESNASANPAASLGLTARAIRRLATNYKFCPDCVARDVSPEGQGFPVIYREHQPPFVRVCAEHLKPLLFGCTKCQFGRTATSRWRMAGRCDCKAPRHDPTHVIGDDVTYEAGVVWLARQARTILHGDSLDPTASPIARLREALANSGFARQGGLNSDAIATALNSRFGPALLSSLGVPEVARTASGTRWVGRLLGSTAVSGERTPDVLRSLLLTGLIADGVEALVGAPSDTAALKAPEPRGYGQQRQLDRALLPPGVIEVAIEASKGKIAAAAIRLGVSPARLAVDMQRQGIRLPLPAATAKRLGSDLIAAVQGALRAGIPKVEIQRSLGVSEWSIQLIELDSPSLRDTHREATIEQQRDSHRRAVLLHRQLHPSASRSDLLNNCVAALDWLRRFDSEWLGENLPRPKRVPSGARRTRKDWHQLDRGYVAAIQSAERAELAKKNRPTRLTATRLLSVAGVPNKKISLVPLAVAEAARCSESKDAFLRRKIVWALHEYVARHVPISMNQLRRVAGLPPRSLKDHADFIVETATALGLTFDARCSLSPLQS